MPDREIVDCILNGEKRLFELLMRRYNRRLFRIARSVIKDNSEAQDILQESYIIAYTKLNTFRGDTNMGAWLAKITLNEALGRLRRRNRQFSLEDMPDPDNVTFLDGQGKTQSHGPGDPEQYAGRQEMLSMIESTIDGLPDTYRAVFMLRAVEQLTTDEAADYLGIKPATVKTRFHRARILVRDRLEHRIDQYVGDAFAFAGRRCDRIVDTVLARIAVL